MRYAVAPIALLVVLPFAVPTMAADVYPSRPVRLMVPFPPGGASDILARDFGVRLTQAWNQQIVIDNRGGAGGNIASEITARSLPDGYTLMIGNAGTHAINPGLYKSLPFDTVKDFTPIALVASVPNLLIVNPSVPVKTVKELIAYIKAQNGKISYASSGVGTPQHLSGELFKTMAGVDMTHVPYKGAAPAVTDVMAGQVPISFPSIPSAIQHARTGKIRAIAVTGPKRSAGAPEIPTIAESGLAGYEAMTWYGFFGAAGMPKDVVQKINGELGKILQAPEMRERLVSQGADPAFSTPKELGDYVVAEIPKWAKIIKASGAKAD